jgi:hypothetical protein
LLDTADLAVPGAGKPTTGTARPSRCWLVRSLAASWTKPLFDLIPRSYNQQSARQKQKMATDLRDIPASVSTSTPTSGKSPLLFDGREEIGHLIRAVLQRGRKIIADVCSGIT